MYPLGLCAFCPCGPKVVREAASVLSLDTERKVKVVGEGLGPPVPAQSKYASGLWGSEAAARRGPIWTMLSVCSEPNRYDFCE
jgi:hypothetical protein